ncbi:MAG: BMC domain-containing protein [Bacteroidales bacterium]|jgi:microcompartment protein CcmL/EutN|nr:BMC domain-containing protein [Bacteroidales bacterium]
MTDKENIIVLGALEFSSIVIGFQALDQMVKVAPIQIIDARTISSGKYLIIFSGDVASVEYAYKAGYETGGAYIVDKLFLPQVHPDVIPAIGNTLNIGEWDTIGIIETLSIVSGIESADSAAKSGGVKIIEIRLADGYGGKSYVKIMGSLDAVQSAMADGTAKAREKNLLGMETIIPQPHKEIKPFFMK